MAILMEVKEVSFNYGTLSVLKDINLKIFTQDYVTFFGANGSGKSTLLKLMLELITPSKGQLILADPAVVNWKNKGQFGYVPQGGLAAVKDFPLTVEELISLRGPGRSLPAFHRTQATLAITELLAVVGLSQKRKALLRELSGGQLQKALIARELYALPKILFLDEPTSALDQAAVLELKQLLATLNRQGLTIIEISHDVSAVQDCETRKIFFQQGTIEELKC